MVGVVQQFHVVGPLALGKVVQPLDRAAERTVRQKAEHSRHHNGVLQLALLDVRLADNGEFGVGATVKQPFRGRQGQWLMPRQQFSLTIPGRETYQHAGQQTGNHADAQANQRMGRMDSHERPVRPHRGDHKRRSNHRGRHVVRVLPERPRVEDEGPEIRQVQHAVRPRRVTNGMLHEGVGGNDEVAGEPGTQEQGQGGGQVSAGA